MFSNILFVLGIIMLVYCVCIAFVGHGTYFFLVWLIGGAACMLLARLISKGVLQQLPGTVKWPITIIVIVGLCIFIFAEGCIISGFGYKGTSDLDYIVVLGAQMKTSGPSKALALRLDKAIDYLEKNENTIVIVSGGQGSDEPVSEAQGMTDYLLAAGIERDRIIQEDKSTNTYENLLFCSKLFDKKKVSIGVISNNFHVFRAVKIAKKMGYRQVYGIAAQSDSFLMVNNMLRESMSLVKDFVIGNL